MFEVQQTTAGEWAVVVAEGRALVVARTDRERLLRYLTAVRTGFAETLDELIADGLGRTPPFGLLDVSDGTAMLAVRGGLRASVTDRAGTRDLRAAVSSWLETRLDEATTVTLGSPSGETLPVAHGIVRGGTLVWTASDDVPAQSSPAPQEAKQSRATEPVILEAAEPTRVSEATIVEAPEREAPEREAASPEGSDAGAPVLEAGYDHLFGATMMRGIEEAAVRPDAAPAEPERIDLPGFITDSFPQAAAVGDHDGLTVLSGDLPRRAAAGPPDPLDQPPVDQAPPRYHVVLSDGRREDLLGPVIVGRAPNAAAVRTLTGARPLTLTGAEGDISRSHVAIAVEGDTVVVTDLHSRNGTLVVLPGKSPQKLRAGEPTTVVAGTVVDLGSGATVTVEASL